MVEARLSTLDRESRDLLSVAACSGDGFDPLLVCEAADVPRLAGLRLFHELERRHGLVRAQGAVYRFDHHVLQEALQEGLPDALRAAYHTALGDALERRVGGAAGTPPGHAEAFRLARHFLLGESPARALPYVPAALDHLYAASEYPRVVRMAAHVLALGDAVPAALRARTLHVEGLARLAYAPPKEAVAPLEEATRLLEGVPEEGGRYARALAAFALAQRNVGRLPEALALTERAVDAAAATDDAHAACLALGERAMALVAVGRAPEAREVARRGLELARASGDVGQVCSIARNLGGIELEAGNLEEAQELLELAASAAHLHGEAVVESSALTVLAKLAYLRADLEGSLEMVERVL
jgi:tetratricopeptide (TPR) repeat protein